jgi:hypothetical protein
LTEVFFSKSLPFNGLSAIAKWAPSLPYDCVIKRGRMKKNPDVVDQTEPIGIIISSGHRDEQPTVFSAYIWGPAPEPTSDPASKAA